MKAEDFVEAVRIAVYEDAVKGIIDYLRKPPGRRPDPQSVELSAWFNRLKSADRDALEKVADLAARQATYNFLLVLDGLVAIEDVGPKGELELIFRKGKTRLRLNDKSGEQLTALFKEKKRN
jgi:hypothetical protein